MIPGLLKARFNVHEVVATIMMNWIAYWSIYYFVPAYLKGPSLETESASIALTQSLRTPWLTKLFNGSYMNLGFFIAIICVILVKFILDKTTLGFGLKTVGFNRHCAEYAGIKVNSNVVISMMIAGGLAGLAGLTFYTGYSRNMQIGVLPAQGFDGIAVALLGASNPIGVFFSSLFFGILQSGKGFMNAMTSVPPRSPTRSSRRSSTSPLPASSSVGSGSRFSNAEEKVQRRNSSMWSTLSSIFPMQSAIRCPC